MSFAQCIIFYEFGINQCAETDFHSTSDINREFKQMRRRRLRERHKTMGFNKQNNALRMRYKFWYISSPFLAKQQREMTKFRANPKADFRS